ncbi:hypothetical protein [Rhodococcus jostii]|uniref:Transmembrane protein n=1 Tax=Rhodococcus jostii TaxID=132919 RepID=A0ABU4CSU9_RHOJO|nr:hypothetical protein [Rhodococcus jostii]MDV6286655.1 hypothetical protein [Rhodococcus jostii]
MRPSQSAPVPVPTPIRWWRLRPWSRNHLMRPSDRYEAVIVMLAAILVLLLIPFAAAFGTATHARLQHQTQALRTSVHQVPAVLLEDSYPAPDTPDDSLRPTGTQDTARARWSTPHGDRTAAVPTDSPAKAGQTVTISVDADGNLTGPLPSTQENTVVAVTAAFGIWALAAGAVVLPTVLAHALFNRNRMRRWAHEWKQFDMPPR